VKTRVKSYPYRKWANVHKDERKIVHTDDPGGIGHEIVQEIAVCPECAAKFAKT
jgi:hypothetical protein